MKKIICIFLSLHGICLAMDKARVDLPASEKALIESIRSLAFNVKISWPQARREAIWLYEKIGKEHKSAAMQMLKDLDVPVIELWEEEIEDLRKIDQLGELLAVLDDVKSEDISIINAVSRIRQEHKSDAETAVLIIWGKSVDFLKACEASKQKERERSATLHQALQALESKALYLPAILDTFQPSNSHGAGVGVDFEKLPEEVACTTKDQKTLLLPKSVVGQSRAIDTSSLPFYVPLDSHELELLLIPLRFLGNNLYDQREAYIKSLSLEQLVPLLNASFNAEFRELFQLLVTSYIEHYKANVADPSTRTFEHPLSGELQTVITALLFERNKRLESAFQVRTCSEFEAPKNSNLVVSSDGKWVFASGLDTAMCWWSLESEKRKSSILPSVPLACACLQGSELFILFSDGLKKLNPVDGTLEHILNEQDAWSFTSNAKEVIALTSRTGLSLYDGKKKSMTKLPLHQDAGNGNGIFFATPQGFFAQCLDAGMLRLWDKHGIRNTITGHKGSILLATCNESSVTTVGSDGTARISPWTGSEAQVTYLEDEEPVCLTPDGCRLLTTNYYGGSVWDLPSSERLVAFEEYGSVSAAAFSSYYLVTVHEERICLRNLDTFEPICCLEKHCSPVTRLVFSPDGKFLISGDNDGKVAVWNLDLVLHEAHSKATISFDELLGMYVTLEEKDPQKQQKLRERIPVSLRHLIS